MHTSVTAKMDLMAFIAKTTLMSVSQILVQTTALVMIVSTISLVRAPQASQAKRAVWTMIIAPPCRASIMPPALKAPSLSHVNVQMDSMAGNVNTILTIVKIQHV